MFVPETFRIEKRAALHDPFFTGAERIYVCGTQDGNFPHRGWHVPGEMGGVWLHPSKLLDGYWLEINGAPLPPADEFISGPFWSEQCTTLPSGLTVRRRQWAPDGVAALVVEFNITAPESRPLPVRVLARSDLRPVWSIRHPYTRTRPDLAHYSQSTGTWHLGDPDHGRFAVLGLAGMTPTVAPQLDSPESAGDPPAHGVTVALDGIVMVGQDSTTFRLLITGSHCSEQDAARVYAETALAIERAWTAKSARYARMLDTATLASPDPDLDRSWPWARCTLDWLMRDVPGTGRGIGAGADDYPWWFGCDTSFTVLGCLALGDTAGAIESLDLVRTLSERNGTQGRVLHECSTSGEVADPGRTQETPQFVAAVGTVYRWTGDRDFLQRNYDFCRRGLLGWTIGEHTTATDPLPTGYGLIEIEGLDRQCIDTAVFTAEGLDALAGMAEDMGDATTAAECRARAVTTRAALERFWLQEEGIYGDLIATPAEMTARLPVWIDRAGESDASRPYVEHLRHLLDEATNALDPGAPRAWYLGHWVEIMPVLHGPVSPERAARILDRVQGPAYTGPHGMYLNALDHSHTMSINTGVLALAQALHGRPDTALETLHRMTATLDGTMPGAIAEMLPDYGCCVQAWSATALAWPVASGFFGLQPDAPGRRLRLEPCFPVDWTEVSLRSLPIGDAHFDLTWRDGTMTVTIDRPGWEIESPRVPLEVIER